MNFTQCRKCVMDGSDPDIVYDEQGVCNHCHNAQKMLKEIEDDKHNLPKIIEQIKKDSKEYDCLIGLSGGADSATVLHNAVNLGLKPLCFSVDNGYNEPKADENVLRMVEKLKVPFYRYRLNLRKFKELQSAFLKAGQKNIEIPTDHILMAATYEMANRYNIRWILSGGNVATESIMPKAWGYEPRDLVHIKDVYRNTYHRKLKELPICGLLKWNYYKWIKGIKSLYLLDYLDYNREKAIETLKQEYDWNDYHEKHCENTFTWWFQNFYLFEKFGIDKRKAHYSSLINSGQMTRSEALEKLKSSPVFPQLGIEGKIMFYERRPYTDFKTDEKLFQFISKVVRKLKKWRYMVSFKHR